MSVNYNVLFVVTFAAGAYLWESFDRLNHLVQSLVMTTFHIGMLLLALA